MTLIRGRSGPDLSHLQLGPWPMGEHRVVLRPPRLDDVAAWRDIRVRDRLLIEPFWAYSPLRWEQRHSDRAWLRECLRNRSEARSGRSVGFVIDVDGELRGQCALTDIDRPGRSAELGIWVDSTLASSGLAILAGSLVSDFAFGTLGAERVTAPVCVGNVRAAGACRKGGFREEALMRNYFRVGADGVERDHLQLTLRLSTVPPEGVTRSLSRYFDPDGTTVGRHMSRAEWPRYWRWSTGGDGLRYLFGAICTGVCGMVGRIGRQRVVGRPVQASGVVLTARSGRDATFTVTVDDVPVGVCGLRGLDELSSHVTAWFNLRPGTDGSLAAVVNALVSRAFAVRGLRRVAVVSVPDSALSDVLADLGFEREGLLIEHTDAVGRRGDHELWGVTVALWNRAMQPESRRAAS
ncbi:GNAT family protein [Gordonia sp. VNQ95]|jgi:ribosomal-protein-alanine N-acetyltransferase|uniref:GNAT family N-acetyltransferase n=1 Tax=Gordonia TaxID=2053 RepID=UPI0032B39021